MALSDPIPVRFSDTADEGLSEISSKTGMSKAELVRIAVAEFLKNVEETGEVVQRIKVGPGPSPAKKNRASAVTPVSEKNLVYMHEEHNRSNVAEGATRLHKFAGGSKHPIHTPSKRPGESPAKAPRNRSGKPAEEPLPEAPKPEFSVSSLPTPKEKTPTPPTP